MKIIKKEIVYDDYKNSNSKISVLKYWEQVEKDETLSKEELISAKKLTNNIFHARQDKYIDEHFIEMFKTDDIKNHCNLSSEMGADIGGIEGNGVKVIFMNVEMGVNIFLQNPKSEDTDKYLKIFELFNLGLDNVEQYKKVLAYYHLDETLENKTKKKTKKI